MEESSRLSDFSDEKDGDDKTNGNFANAISTPDSNRYDQISGGGDIHATIVNEKVYCCSRLPPNQDSSSSSPLEPEKDNFREENLSEGSAETAKMDGNDNFSIEGEEALISEVHAPSNERNVLTDRFVEEIQSAGNCGKMEIGIPADSQNASISAQRIVELSEGAKCDIKDKCESFKLVENVVKEAVTGMDDRKTDAECIETDSSFNDKDESAENEMVKAEKQNGALLSDNDVRQSEIDSERIVSKCVDHKNSFGFRESNDLISDNVKSLVNEENVHVGYPANEESNGPKSRIEHEGLEFNDQLPSKEETPMSTFKFESLVQDEKIKNESLDHENFKETDHWNSETLHKEKDDESEKAIDDYLKSEHSSNEIEKIHDDSIDLEKPDNSETIVEHGNVCCHNDVDSKDRNNSETEPVVQDQEVKEDCLDLKHFKETESSKIDSLPHQENYEDKKIIDGSSNGEQITFGIVDNDCLNLEDSNDSKTMVRNEDVNDEWLSRSENIVDDSKTEILVHDENFKADSSELEQSKKTEISQIESISREENDKGVLNDFVKGDYPTIEIEKVHDEFRHVSNDSELKAENENVLPNDDESSSKGKMSVTESMVHEEKVREILSDLQHGEETEPSKLEIRDNEKVENTETIDDAHHDFTYREVPNNSQTKSEDKPVSVNIETMPKSGNSADIHKHAFQNEEVDEDCSERKVSKEVEFSKIESLHHDDQNNENKETNDNSLKEEYLTKGIEDSNGFETKVNQSPSKDEDFSDISKPDSIIHNKAYKHLEEAESLEIESLHHGENSGTSKEAIDDYSKENHIEHLNQECKSKINEILNKIEFTSVSEPVVQKKRCTNESDSVDQEISQYEPEAQISLIVPQMEDESEEKDQSTTPNNFGGRFFRRVPFHRFAFFSFACVAGIFGFVKSFFGFDRSVKKN